LIGSWCNGNTADFGSVIQGSSPCDPTNIKRNCLSIKQLRFFYFVGIFKKFICLENGWGVAAQADDGFDFEEPMSEIKLELADLDREAAVLAGTIQEHLNELGL